MKTGYTVKEGKHTSLLEDGFMPVETALGVPVQEQLNSKLINLINSNFEDIRIIKIYYV